MEREVPRSRNRGRLSFKAIKELFLRLPLIPATLRSQSTKRQQCVPESNKQTILKVLISGERPTNQSNPISEHRNESHAEPKSSTACIINLDSLRPQDPNTSLSTSGYISDTSQSLTVAPIVEHTPEIFQVDKAFISPNMEMDREIFQIWQVNVEEQLRNTLHRTGHLGMQLECYMAGLDRTDLKPTILIFCKKGTSPKTVNKNLMSFKWLHQYPFRCMVLMETKENELKLLSKGNLESNPPYGNVKAKVDLGRNTLCGTRAEIEGTSLQEHRFFTLGGLISVRDQVFSLTVGHVIWPPDCESPLPELDDADVSDEISMAGSPIKPDSPFVIIGNDDAVENNAEASDNDPQRGLNEGEKTKDGQDEISYDDLRLSLREDSAWTPVGQFMEFTTPRSNSVNVREVNPPLSLDWAVVTVANEDHWLGNLVQIPGDASPTLIEDTISEANTLPGLVWALTGSDRPQPGYLSECSVSLHLQGRQIGARQITFKEALVPGDSGTWVIQDGKLCGHIVAGRAGLRWAYMVPIEGIFDEIKTCFGTTDVHVFRSSFAEELRQRSKPATANLPTLVSSHENSLGVGSASLITYHHQHHVEENSEAGTTLVASSQTPSKAPDLSVPASRDGNTVSPTGRKPTTSALHDSPLLASSTGNVPDDEAAQPDEERRNSAGGVSPSMNIRGTETHNLRPDLGSVSILMIAISGVVGASIFTDTGRALEVAGPGGALVSYAFMGVVAIGVMECVSEMAQLFPVPNAIVEYVNAFIDPDLARVIGVAYWYTYSSIFVILLISAADFATYWGIAQVWKTLIFYVLSPLVILIANFMAVKWFGIFETVSGLLKLCLVVGCAVLMYITAERRGVATEYLQDGFQNDPAVAKNSATAICYAIPFVAHGFLGVEIVAITAAEARSSKSLAVPSRFVAYVVLICYFLCSFGEFLNVKWTNPNLQSTYFKSGNVGSLKSAAILAVQGTGYRNIPGVLNGCIIFAVLTTSNTALYVASRTLYGMTRQLRPKRFPITWLSKAGKADMIGIPKWALLISIISFIWLPLLSLKGDVAVHNLIDILSLSATVSCLLVWASLCLAYIRYYRWVKIHLQWIRNSGYDRTSPKWKGKTLLDYCQPLPAYLGLICCLLIALGFTSSLWWHSNVTFAKFAAAYASPIVMFAIWVCLKLFRYRKTRPKISRDLFYVVLDDEFATLARTLYHLRELSKDIDPDYELPYQ